VNDLDGDRDVPTPSPKYLHRVLRPNDGASFTSIEMGSPPAVPSEHVGRACWTSSRSGARDPSQPATIRQLV